VHYVEIITFLLSTNNVIDVVQTEGTLDQIGRVRGVDWRRACWDMSPDLHVTSRYGRDGPSGIWA